MPDPEDDANDDDDADDDNNSAVYEGGAVGSANTLTPPAPATEARSTVRYHNHLVYVYWNKATDPD
eukprot:4379078-Heterocapsa_arctica.AAC.1